MKSRYNSLGVDTVDVTEIDENSFRFRPYNTFVGGSWLRLSVLSESSLASVNYLIASINDYLTILVLKFRFFGLQGTHETIICGKKPGTHNLVIAETDITPALQTPDKDTKVTLLKLNSSLSSCLSRWSRPLGLLRCAGRSRFDSVHALVTTSLNLSCTAVTDLCRLHG